MGGYLAAINSQRRVLATIGLERRKRDVTPSLADIAAEIEAEREATQRDADAEHEAAE